VEINRLFVERISVAQPMKESATLPILILGSFL
jgi:hypothetical protein